MKKLFALMLGQLSCILLCLSVNAVELYVDTELVQTDVPPQLVSGRTLVHAGDFCVSGRGGHVKPISMYAG